MNCPKCLVPLSMSDRQGVEIDFCPQCRGVWLDRGELDKIIERAGAVMAPVQPVRPAAGPPPIPGTPPPDYRKRDRDDDDDDYRRDRDSGYPPYGKKKKKEGFFSDLFDF